MSRITCCLIWSTRFFGRQQTGHGLPSVLTISVVEMVQPQSSWLVVDDFLSAPGSGLEGREGGKPISSGRSACLTPADAALASRVLQRGSRGSGGQAGLVPGHIMTGSEIGLGLVQTGSQKRAESRLLRGEAVTQPTCG